MNDQVEALLDGLEELVLQAHRSATDLDYIVMSIRDKEDLDEESFNYYVQAAAELRARSKKLEFGDIERAENVIWEAILEEVE